MTYLFAMCIFALVMSITPGPVNVISLYSGAAHGVRVTLPFVFGATFGFCVLLLSIGLGMGQIFQQHEIIPVVMKYLGSAFLLYMSYKIFTSSGKIQSGEVAIPRFSQGMLLQWLNPKAWAASLSGTALFVPSENTSALLVFVGLYFLICYVSLGSWVVLGAQAQALLNDEIKLVLFNRLLGSVLAGVTLYLFFA